MTDRTRKPPKPPARRTLKKTETSVIKQSFSHGRTKSVVVEKRRRNSEDAFNEAARVINHARQVGASELDLRIEGLNRLPSFHKMSALRSIDLEGTRVANIAALESVPALQSLNLANTQVSNIVPLQVMRNLEMLFLENCPVVDITPLSNLRNLQYLNLANSRVARIAPLAELNKLRLLSISNTDAFDLSSLARTTTLVDGAVQDSTLGLHFSECLSLKPALRSMEGLENPRRTLDAINYLREEQRLPPYRVQLSPESDGVDGPTPLEGIPAPFDFEQTTAGTITVADSDTNLPAFPFATSREDHTRRLEACKTYAEDLIEAIEEHRYHNVRAEFLTCLRRYLERLPSSASGGNMLLADGMARTLTKLFAAEAEILPAGFASELHTLLEQHIAACVYYPEVGTFNRDVRDGTPSRPFPIHAAEAFAKAIQKHTPNVFEPPVARAFSEAQTVPPPVTTSSDIPAASPQTLTPPTIPGGETDPKKSREFATASTANRLWKRVHLAASVTTVVSGIGVAAHDLAPYASELLQWLAEILKNFPIIQ